MRRGVSRLSGTPDHEKSGSDLGRAAQLRPGAALILRLQAAAGNRATSALMDGAAPAVQRAVLTVGHAVIPTMSPKEIADHAEIEEAAAAIVNKHGGASQPFSTGSLGPKENWVVGHSDGSVIAGVKEEYNAEGLAAALARKGIAPGSKLRLVGCRSGADINSIAAQTARSLQAVHNVAGVQVKGAVGILIKTTAPGRSGVYDKIGWNAYHKKLTTAYHQFLVAAVGVLKDWLGSLTQDTERWLACYELEEFARAINVGVAGTQKVEQFICAQYQFDNPTEMRKLIDPELDKIPELYKTSQTFIMETRFPVVRDALNNLGNKVQSANAIPTKLDLTTLWNDHLQRVKAATLEWLRTGSVKPESRHKPGTGNKTWTMRAQGGDPVQVLKSVS